MPKPSNPMNEAEFERRAEVIEDALYALKNSDYANAPDVLAIDNFLALQPELKVELFGLLVERKPL